MRLTSLIALLLAIFTTVPAISAPAFPENIEPSEWKADPELKEIIDGILEIPDQEALAAYLEKMEKTLERHPEWLDLHRLYLALAKRTERVDEIYSEYRAAAEADSTDPNKLYLLGIIETSPESEKHQRRALAVDENHYHALCALGVGLATGELATRDEGFEYLFEALWMRPDHPYVYQALASAYYKSQDFAKGVRISRLWQVVEPYSVQPVHHEVLNLEKLDQIEEAIARMEKFTEDHPDNVAGLRNMANVYRKWKRTDELIDAQVRLAEAAKNSHLEALRAAKSLAVAGRNAEANIWLLVAAERGFDDSRSIENDVDFKAVRSMQAYKDALAAMEQAHAAKVPALKEKILSELIKRPAPAFAVETLDGEDVSLEGWKGKIVILDFWATWCKPCTRTLPMIQDLYLDMQGRPVEIICMNVWERDSDKKNVAPYWARKGFSMPVGLAGNHDAINYGVEGIPALYVIDQEGQIRYQHRGFTPFMDEEVTWVVDHLLGAD